LELYEKGAVNSAFFSPRLLASDPFPSSNPAFPISREPAALFCPSQGLSPVFAHVTKIEQVSLYRQDTCRGIDFSGTQPVILERHSKPQLQKVPEKPSPFLSALTNQIKPSARNGKG